MTTAEVNKIETRKTIKKINKTKKWFFEKIKLAYVQLVRKKANSNKTINKREHITIYTNIFKRS